MAEFVGWSRREFLAGSGAAAAHVAAGSSLLGEAQRGVDANVIPPPIVITGGIKPLFEEATYRPLRYKPEGNEFVIRNGGEFFNRPIYGASAGVGSDFRVDAGDWPEFSLYLPGHGGNLKVGVVTAAGAKWAAEFSEVTARYRPGRMLYELKDPLLGAGTLRLEVLTAGSGAGVLVKCTGVGMPAGVSLAWGFAGASGRKGARNGDIGCESQPVSQFFQVRAEECAGNMYVVGAGDAGGRLGASLRAGAIELGFTFPAGAKLRVAEFAEWAQPPSLSGASVGSRLPILAGSVALGAEPLYLTVRRRNGEGEAEGDPAAEFEARGRDVEGIAGALVFSTPDPYLDAAAPALCVAAEGLWDARQECVMHGDVAWRVALAGWRGPYVLSELGEHERAKAHFRHWLKRQNVSAVVGPEPAVGPADPKTRLTRKEGMLHSNGDMSGNHYDMNLVFFDVLLRHLRWTGDVEFAREVWPAFQRHLAWERRLFRRTYAGAAGKELPLYEAYAVIWASDNLQYSGGGTAHASAYNVFALRAAAGLARMVGEDPAPYEAEAELVREAMDELLWVRGQGAFAESKDILGAGTVYNNPALWTVYHTVDSEVPTARQSWQMVAERLAVLRRVPVHGEGVPAGAWYMLACSDWLPYLWSLTLLVLAENMHMALAMWQAGMADEAYGLLKGNLLDSMYMGLCPGDFHMSSALDAHRQEAQRDFGDPIGITSRALVEGLFGVRPDLMRGRVEIVPGFPREWDRASLRHKDFDFAWMREGMAESYTFTSRFGSTVGLTLVVPARSTSLPVVTNAGRPMPCVVETESVGVPKVRIELPAATSYTVFVQWHGRATMTVPEVRSYGRGEVLALPRGVALERVDDPQGCLRGGRVEAEGFHTVFANMREGEMRWTLPISFTVRADAPAFKAIPVAAAGAVLETVDLSAVLRGQITDIFTRGYGEPRSPYCSLGLPDTLLGGWANIGAPEVVDDAGLRGAGGVLRTGVGVPFRTPAGSAPNCAYLSYFKPDETSLKVPLRGEASGVYFLMAGTTVPQCSRMEHGHLTVRYADGGVARLSLRNPETWWPVDQDYLLDDYLFVNDAPLPPRVDLRSGATRVLDAATFKGKGRKVPGGAATVLHLPLDLTRELAGLEFEVTLYGVVGALLGVTLVRGSLTQIGLAV